jgi:DNA excision repair protein ERCC-4
MAARTQEEPPPVICPFYVVVDNQEQLPYRFTGIEQGNPSRLLVVRTITDRHLPTGDYSIQGFEDKICIERKSFSDWVGSIGGEHEREKRKAERMSSFEYAAYVIEADWETMVRKWPASSQNGPQVALGTIAGWSVNFGVHFFLLPSRRDSELWTFKLLAMFYRRKIRQEQEREEQEKQEIITDAAE